MKRHDVDWVSLIAGGVFLLIATTHLVGAATDARPHLEWLAPVLLVGVGLAGLASAVRGVRSPREEPVKETGGEPGAGWVTVGCAGALSASDILGGARQVARVANGSGL